MAGDTLKKKPVTGMRDIMPDEMRIRDYVISIIKDTYGKYGFSTIETPCVEHIENLTSKQGGDNEKLIFKILKRGEKLKLAGAKSELDIVDGGLRYDLTVPLARYYSAHQSELGSVFKALQIGSVWRADRPQKGRFRQFVQCDIDILGDASVLAETELIIAAGDVLSRLGFEGFTIRVNDRRILRAMAIYSGFDENLLDPVYIILDKMDKIGQDGVRSELLDKGFDSEAVDKYLGLFAGSDLKMLGEKLEGVLGCEVIEGMEKIFSIVESSKIGNYKLAFDPSLVRGMSYYTGPVFEIVMDEFGSSVGGGGRYDGMIGRFTGNDTCACGFSIGFERIVMLLLERGYKIPDDSKRIAYLVEKNMPSEKVLEIFLQAADERSKGNTVSIICMNKNKKFQKEQLKEAGYNKCVEFFVS